MLFFKRNKIKLSLIEDYVQLVIISNFFKNDFSFLNDKNKIIIIKYKQMSSTLLTIYNQTFVKLKMNDLSLLILKKDLKNNNSLYLREESSQFSMFDKTLDEIFVKLTLILNGIKEKQKELKLIPFA